MLKIPKYGKPPFKSIPTKIYQLILNTAQDKTISNCLFSMYRPLPSADLVILTKIDLPPCDHSLAADKTLSPRHLVKLQKLLMSAHQVCLRNVSTFEKLKSKQATKNHQRILRLRSSIVQRK